MHGRPRQEHSCRGLPLAWPRWGLLDWVEHEVVGDLLAVAGFGWLHVEHQFRLHRGGDVIVVVRVAREVQLGGEQLVARCRNLQVQVGWAPSVPTGGGDQLAAGAVGRNLVRSRLHRVDQV